MVPNDEYVEYAPKERMLQPVCVFTGDSESVDLQRDTGSMSSIHQYKQARPSSLYSSEFFLIICRSFI